MHHQFGEETTAEEVATVFSDSIKGKTVLITGATWNGLGAEAARVIAKHGAGLVIIAGRRQSALDDTISKIKQETPNASLRSLVFDLASLASVRQAAKQVNNYTEPIDVLINNAATMTVVYGKTVDGFEAHFGTNHLGPFLFTNLILPRLLASTYGARIVNVSSKGHQLSQIRFTDYGFSEGKNFEKWQAYGQSKTANILFAKGLSDRYKNRGILAFSLHPGIVATNMASNFDMAEEFKEDVTDAEGNFIPAEELARRIKWKTISQGAATHIVAAFDPSITEQSGSYLEDANINNEAASLFALDASNAQKLWNLSEQLTGETFP